ncbi:MAG: TonB-dependent receptor [Nannocystaceae bacterium]
MIRRLAPGCALALALLSPTLAAAADVEAASDSSRTGRAARPRAPVDGDDAERRRDPPADADADVDADADADADTDADADADVTARRSPGADRSLAAIAAGDPATRRAPTLGEGPDEDLSFGTLGACHPEPAPYRSVVTQSRAPRTAGEEVIDAQAIAVAPRRRSADDLLRLVPGVWLSQHGSEGKGQQIFLRGFDAAHGTDVAVSVAGIPVNELSNLHGQGYIDLNFVIPEVVRRINVRKGPFSVQDGNFATAGAIDMELGVADNQRGTRVSYQLGSTGRHRALVLLAPKRRSMRRTFAAIEAMQDRGFAVNRDARRLATIGQVQLHESREVGTVDLLASGYVADFGTPNALREDDLRAGVIDRYDTYADDTRGRSIRGITALRHTRRGRGRLDHQLYGQIRLLELTEDFSGYLLDPVSGDRRLQSHRSIGGGYRLDHELPLGERMVLITGARWQGERLDQFEDAVDADHGVTDHHWDLTVNQHQLAGLAAVRYMPTSWLTAELGGRVDLFHYTVDNHLAEADPDADPGSTRARKTLVWPSPRLSLRYRLAERWYAFTAYGRGLRAPEARSILASQSADADLSRYRGGDAQVTPTDTAELGARYQGRRFTAGTALFGTWIAHELVYDHVSGINLDQNGTRRLGGELDLRVRPREWIELRSDLTLVHARFIESGARVPNAPPLLWSMQATLIHRSGLSGGARLWVLGPRPLPYGATASPVTLVDLSASYRISRLQIDLQIDNLLNSKWKEGEYNFASWWDRSSPRSALPTLHQLSGAPTTVRLGATLWL